MLMAPLDYLDSWTALCAPSSRLPQRQGQTLGQTQIGSGALGALGECSRQPLRSRGLFFYCLILLVRRSSPSPRRGMRHIAGDPARASAPPRAAAVRCACGCAVRGLRLKQNKSSPALDA